MCLKLGTCLTNLLNQRDILARENIFFMFLYVVSPFTARLNALIFALPHKQELAALERLSGRLTQN